MPEDQGSPSKLLVLGLGNILSADDGLGVVLIQQLAERVDPDWPVELIEAGVGGLRLLNIVEDAPAILAIDAAQMNLPPATVRWLTPGQLSRPSEQGFSLHDVDFTQTLWFADRFFSRPATAIMAVQIENAAAGAGLSRPIKDALPKLLDELTCALRNWRDRAEQILELVSDCDLARRDEQLLDWLDPRRQC